MCSASAKASIVKGKRNVIGRKIFPFFGTG
jgi:hypothetical protein